ncbi:hypothetical protein, partial [Yersinia rochesterensis]|uniref:hypothetical protein n=1 Tax=Yersinia rochesterensis TaxID=1604335 RepID=UPI00119CF439
MTGQVNSLSFTAKLFSICISFNHQNLRNYKYFFIFSLKTEVYIVTKDVEIVKARHPLDKQHIKLTYV